MGKVLTSQVGDCESKCEDVSVYRVYGIYPDVTAFYFLLENGMGRGHKNSCTIVAVYFI